VYQVPDGFETFRTNSRPWKSVHSIENFILHPPIVLS
jgi:hypothetical protein